MEKTFFLAIFFLFSVRAWADPYQDLGVSPTSTLEEIKKVYKAKIKEVHPDLKHKWEGRLTKEQAEALTKKYNDAYDSIKKNHAGPKTSSSPNENRRPNYQKWEPKDFSQQKANPPPPISPEEWERRIKKGFSGNESELPSYLRTLLKNNPLLEKENYKQGLKQYLTNEVTPIVKKTNDPRFIHAIAQSFNKPQNIYNLWLKDSSDADQFIKRLKDLKPLLSDTFWKDLKSNLYQKFFSSLDEMELSLNPPTRTSSVTVKKTTAPKSCLKHTLASKVYRQMGGIQSQGRGSTIDLKL